MVICNTYMYLAMPVSTASVTPEIETLTSATILNHESEQTTIEEETTTESTTSEVELAETSQELTQNVTVKPSTGSPGESTDNPVEGISTNSPLSTHEATAIYKTTKPMKNSTESSSSEVTDKTSTTVVTSKLTTTLAVQTEPPVTTPKITTAHNIPTAQATTKRLQLTTHTATQLPQAVITRTLATEKHQPENTEGNHPAGTGEDHEGGDNHHDMRSTIKPIPGGYLLNVHVRIM